MIDLTKITTPFGLLDEETKGALKSYKGEIQIYTSGGWYVSRLPLWDRAYTYRAKPGPSEFWLCGGIVFTVPEAANDLSQKIGQGIVHVREVM